MSDILIVFANYNGLRTANNLKKPRLLVTLDSFRAAVPNFDAYDVLLLDTNSNDGSEKLFEPYISGTWRYKRYKKEYFYLGTLNRILHKYHSIYKYILVIDNDQYFFRSGFLETAISIMDDNHDVINIQINETTYSDLYDHNKHTNAMVGLFDHVGLTRGELWMKSSQCRKSTKWFYRTSPQKGGGRFHIPGKKESRRACWLWWASSATLLRASVVKNIFDSNGMHPPFSANKDRLALFAYYMNKHGRTVWLGRGGCINFGFRKRLAKNFDLRSHISNHHKTQSLFTRDEYSFFVRGRKLYPINTEINKVSIETV